jgi:hypothetical protein
MAYKDESEYKTSAEKREYDKIYNNDPINVERKRQWRASKKQNILYIITIGDQYYFGHASTGLDARIANHIKKLETNKHNRKMQKIFNDLGRDEFMKIFDSKILGVYTTKDDAALAESYLISLYKNNKECLNCLHK